MGLYPNRDALVEMGLIKKSKDKRIISYTITNHTIELITERRQWEDFQLESIELQWVNRDSKFIRNIKFTEGHVLTEPGSDGVFPI